MPTPPMTLHPAPQQATPDDTIWTTETPPQAPAGLEPVMLAEDKLYVVLAVVLIIWLGLVYYIFRTDRRLRALERTMEQRIPSEESERV